MKFGATDAFLLSCADTQKSNNTAQKDCDYLNQEPSVIEDICIHFVKEGGFSRAFVSINGKSLNGLNRLQIDVNSSGANNVKVDMDTVFETYYKDSNLQNQLSE